MILVFVKKAKMSVYMRVPVIMHISFICIHERNTKEIHSGEKIHRFSHIHTFSMSILICKSFILSILFMNTNK